MARSQKRSQKTRTMLRQFPFSASRHSGHFGVGQFGGTQQFGGAQFGAQQPGAPQQFDETPYIPQQCAQLLFNRYRILETRATGGFGSVEICWDTRLQRRVAIKKLPLQTPEAVGAGADAGALGDSPQDFYLQGSTMQEALNEARTASMLSHPNIVSVYDFEWDGIYAYLVMEYVDGLSLQELLMRLEGGTLTGEEWNYILQDIAAALSFAHENGMLHLDIKPANIMIDHTGTPKLTDFGMATLASLAGFADARGGTIGYMPPEQLAGQLVDERCDLFALAVCMVQALTGANPFEAPTAEASAKLIMRGADDYIAQLRLDYGPLFAEALQRALSPDLARRTASVADFVDEVRDDLGDPQQGKASICDLIAQTTDDEEEPVAAFGVPLRFAERVPWLPNLLAHVGVAISSALLLYPFLPALIPDVTQAAQTAGGAPVAQAAQAADATDLQTLLIRLGICTVLGILSAAFGGIGLAISLGLSFVCACIATDTLNFSTFSAGIIGLALIGSWWQFTGRKRPLASLGLALSAVLRAPAAAVFVGCALLTPAQAAFTTLMGWLTYHFASVAFIQGFSLQSVVLTGQKFAENPQLFAPLACFLAASVAGSFFTNKHTRWAAIFGNSVTLALVIVGLVAPLYMENAGIWSPASVLNILLAVLLFGLSTFVTIVFDTPSITHEAREAEHEVD